MTAAEVHDAELEAAEWRETARRWRKRALREGGLWRRKARELEKSLERTEIRRRRLEEDLAAAKREILDRLPTAEGKRLEREAAEARLRATKVDYYESHVKAVEKRTNDVLAKKNRELVQAHEDASKATVRENHALAALKVVAVRLRVIPDDRADPHELAAEIDRHLVRLLNERGSF